MEPLHNATAAEGRGDTGDENGFPTRTVGAEGKWENSPDGNSTENSSSSVSLAHAPALG